MKRPISDIYLEVNGQRINVGKVICECDDGLWFMNSNEYITNTEWENRKKNSEIGDQQIDDIIYHCVGVFEDNISLKPIESKWIAELVNMGYNVKARLRYENRLIYEIKE